MFTRKGLFIILAASALLLAVGISYRFVNTAQALPSAPTTVIIPYPGRLSDEAGRPVADGAYDFAFALYDAESGGTLLWSETQRGVPVQAGAFAVSLPIPAAALDGREHWLAVSVRGPGEGEFTALSPRQVLSAALLGPASPSAGPACAHNHVGEVWNASVSWSNAALRINNSADGPALWGNNTGGGNGVRGESNSGLGVYGWSYSNSAVVGRSEGKNGVEGYSFSTLGAGVYGEGLRYGLRGRATTAGWPAVYSDGDLFVTTNATIIGDLTVGGSKSGYVVDLAQNDDTAALELGDVVVISGVGLAIVGETPTIKVRRAAAGETSAVIGVVDKHFVPASAHAAGADPHTLAPSYDNSVIAPGEYLTIVTLGSFKTIKVDASYGAIAPGDLLVASPNPGYAMRAAAPKPGTIIGKALDALPSGIGVIPVIITLQ